MGFVASIPWAGGADNVLTEDDREEDFNDGREPKLGAVWYEAADETRLFRWLLKAGEGVRAF
jgi:hypothetical protein